MTKMAFIHVKMIHWDIMSVIHIGTSIQGMTMIFIWEVKIYFRMSCVIFKSIWSNIVACGAFLITFCVHNAPILIKTTYIFSIYYRNVYVQYIKYIFGFCNLYMIEHQMCKCLVDIIFSLRVMRIIIWGHFKAFPHEILG